MIDILEELKKGRIEVYSNKLSKKDIGGSLSKRFVRVSSDLFGDLWDKIANGKTSAFTYVNNEVKNGNTPNYVSCMLKKVRNDQIKPKERVMNEQVSMAIADFFGMPFAYMVPATIDGQLYTLSIDFVPFGYDTSSFFEFANDDSLDLFSSLEEYSNLAYKTFFKNAKNVPNDKKYSYAQEKTEELIKQFFFKKYILGDGDANGNNMGVLESNNDLVLTPLFDNEQAFSSRINNDALVRDVVFLRKKYPKILDDILNLKKSLFQNNYKKLRSSINPIVQDEKLSNQMMIFIVQNLTNIDVANSMATAEGKDFF